MVGVWLVLRQDWEWFYSECNVLCLYVGFEDVWFEFDFVGASCDGTFRATEVYGLKVGDYQWVFFVEKNGFSMFAYGGDLCFLVTLLEECEKQLTESVWEGFDYFIGDVVQTRCLTFGYFLQTQVKDFSSELFTYFVVGLSSMWPLIWAMRIFL